MIVRLGLMNDMLSFLTCEKACRPIEWPTEVSIKAGRARRAVFPMEYQGKEEECFTRRRVDWFVRPINGSAAMVFEETASHKPQS